MKNLIRLSIALLIVVAFTFTGATQKYLKKIQDSGELRVGLTAQQPPFSMKDNKGNYIGYEVELAELLAKSMELKLTVVELPFSELLTSLDQGKIDMVMSGMTMTTKRNMKSVFIGPYIISGKSILTKSPSYSGTDEADDLNTNTIKVVVLEGSTSEMYVKKEIPEAELLRGSDYDACIKMLENKQAQIMVADYPICVYTALLHPEKNLITIDKPLTIEPIGAALPRDAAHFINLVENYFNRLALVGELGRMEEYWFDSGEWVDQVIPLKGTGIY